MKGLLAIFGILAVLGGIVFVASPATARAIGSRATAFFDATPDLPPPKAPAAPAASRGVVPVPSPAVPSWRRKDREAASRYDAGDFAGAAALWTEALAAAPGTAQYALRPRLDRARVFDILAPAPAAPLPPPSAEDEAEVRRRIEGLKEPAAGDWLSIAAYCRDRGVRHHLPYLYERAFERRADGTGALDK